MKKYLFLATVLPPLLIIVIPILLLPHKIEKTAQGQGLAVTPHSAPPAASLEFASSRQEKHLIIRERGNDEPLTLRSYTIAPFQGKTDVYLGSNGIHQFSLAGFFRKAYAIDIENDGNEELVIEVETGHSIDTSVYKHSNKKLHRILISDGTVTAVWESVTARNTPEFKDVDNDGVLELLAYYRFFPPEKKRRVELYKFNGREFQKTNEFEEETESFYL